MCGAIQLVRFCSRSVSPGDGVLASSFKKYVVYYHSYQMFRNV